MEGFLTVRECKDGQTLVGSGNGTGIGPMTGIRTSSCYFEKRTRK